MIKRVCAVFFSPMGSTKELALRLSEALSRHFSASFETIDVTLPEAREQSCTFGPDDLVICASPTNAGKLPNKILPFWREHLRGGGARAVALASFGNRAFENSLAEMADCLLNSGFALCGGGAFVCRHVFSDTIAAGRPNEADLAELDAFAEALIARIEAGSGDAPAIPGDAGAPYYTPLGIDGEPKVFLKAKPKTSDDCIHCGICPAVCPMGAISFDDETEVPGTCIKCQACVRQCPIGAKYFDDEAFLSHVALLERDYQRPAENLWVV